MAISRWTVWGRSLRTNRPLRSRHDNEDDYVQFDLSKDLKDNIKECLIVICQRYNVTSIKKLAHLNAFVKLISESETVNYGYSLEKLLCCLRIGLIHEATQVRAATLRAVRYLLKTAEDVAIINKLQYPYFIARSMDVFLKNEIERMQAVRLARRILMLSPKDFSPALMRSLVSLTDGGIEDITTSKDRGFRVYLATLCEVGVLNSNLLIECGGLGVLMRASLIGQSPGMIESVIGVILKLLANPDTRKNVSLVSLAWPYCEIDSSNSDKIKTDRLQLYTASKLALLSVLRSYSGVIHFCHPNNNAGLKAIVDILYVEQLEVRGAILELFYELLGLTLPAWTDEPDVALAAVDLSRYRDSWKLTNGFVVAEGKSILPSLMIRRPNIAEIHLALLVFILLECGLHRALAETIVTSDTFISVRAAVLLGALLHFAHTLLPPEVCDLAPSLPNLLEHASTGKHQALTAISILVRIHTLMRNKPIPASLFLDRLLQASAWLRPTLTRRTRPSIRNWLKRETPNTLLLKDTLVLIEQDARLWNWPVVRSILRSREDSTRTLSNSEHKMFIKKLVRYFKPSSNNFCRVELATNASQARESTLAGCDLVNCLIDSQEPESTKMLNDLIGDISEQITAIKTSESAHDCLFSPRLLFATCCQKYFLFLGQLSHSTKGMMILKNFNMLEKLQDLAITTNHDCYTKLIVSSLDYSQDGPSRKVLSKIISDAKSEGTRLYATKFLRLIIRVKMMDAHSWVISVLTGRLVDSSKAVALAALEILYESCEESQYLEELFQQVSNNKETLTWLENLGDHGYLLKVRLYSLRSSFLSLTHPLEELEKWIKNGGYAERYVGLVEGEIHDSFTRRQRNENGNYIRRNSSMNSDTTKDVFIAPHLVGQFVQHDLGMQLLLRRNVIQRFTRVIQRFKIEYVNGNDDEGGAGTSVTGTAVGSAEESYFLSGESALEDGVESNRLQTIIDSEIMDTKSPPQKKEPLSEARRKFSFDDSRRSTPERSWKMEPEPEFQASLNSNLETALIKVKAALWLLGHIGTSAIGVDHLNNLGIIEMMTNIAESCPYYSVRATAMYSLSLIATTRNGADTLTSLDWPCVRHLRGDHWQVIQLTTNPYPAPSPSPVQRHHRSLSDGKPEFPEPISRRTRNRSESAATDFESRKYALLERGETPSPGSSIHKLSQQDAEGYAKLRSLQRHRRPSYSQSSLEMYSLDERLSLQSLSEFESSRSCIAENVVASTPPLPVEQDDSDVHYMGICLPKKLTTIFPSQPQTTSTTCMNDEKSKINNDVPADILEESCPEIDEEAHTRICLICHDKKFKKQESLDEEDIKIKKEIIKHTLRLSNPLWYRYSRQVLLRLRQRYPDKFQDACLFSEVASRLENNCYRLVARRFLQELFLESNFESVYTEPLLLLNVIDETKSKTEQTKTTSNEVNDGETNSNNSVEMIINGRINNLNIPGVDELGIVKEEMSGEMQSVESQSNTTLTATTPLIEGQPRRTDEKIIADILKPEERLRLSRNSGKLFKSTDKNTAISLD